MERANRSLAESLRALLCLYRGADGTFSLPKSVSRETFLKILNTGLPEECAYFENASEVVWDIARHMGYAIPACPVESSGEAHAFLSEWGVKNSEGWLQKHGFSSQHMHNLYATSCIMVRNQAFWRKLIPFSRLDAETASDLAPYVIEAIDFALGDTTQEKDATIFMC